MTVTASVVLGLDVALDRTTATLACVTLGGGFILVCIAVLYRRVVIPVRRAVEQLSEIVASEPLATPVPYRRQRVIPRADLARAIEFAVAQHARMKMLIDLRRQLENAPRPEMFTRIGLGYLGEVLDADGGLFLYAPDEREESMRVMATLGPKYADRADVSLDVCEMAKASPGPFWLEDGVPSASVPTSEVAIPLIGEGRVRGLILLSRSGGPAFDLDEVTTVGWLATSIRYGLDRILMQDEALREAEIWKAVMEALDTGILIYRNEREAVTRNEAMRRIHSVIGLTETEGEQTETIRVHAVEALLKQPERFAEDIHALMADGERTATFDIETKAGTILSLRTAPAKMPDGTVVARVFAVSDVTSERRLAQLKNDLISYVSHEIRTPLTSVMGFAEIVLAAEDMGPETREFVKIIHAETGRLTQMLDDLLDLERIEAGGREFRPHNICVAELCERVVHAFPEARDRIRIHPVRRDVTAFLDAEIIHEAVSNLISNALKYSDCHAPVTLSVDADEDSVRIVVEDRGIGIAPDDLPRLFQRFFRTDAAREAGIPGTGLGLALTRELVALHAGEVRCTSRQGEGSTFTISLPLRAGPREAEE